ncbi:MAG: hypothetical protein OXG82_19220 [Gammaproteobacteria bacterium]|nr:hypothetical protein [Gammaproteobacteria bacterium]
MDAKPDLPEDRRESVEAEARSSFGSMLSVVQAGLLQGERDVDGGLGGERRGAERGELLDRHGIREVGETGMSVFRYVGVAASMEQRRSALVDAEPPLEMVRAVELLGRHREERLGVARRDEYRWRLVARPAELLDLDSVVLMQVALAAGFGEAALREWTGWAGGDVEGAPLDVAVQLR